MSDDVVFDRDGEPHFDSACARRDYYRQEETRALRREVEEACLEMIRRIDEVFVENERPPGSVEDVFTHTVEDPFPGNSVPDPMTAPEVSPFQRIIDKLKEKKAHRDD